MLIQKLLNAESVGEKLSLSKRTVFRLDSSGKIPAPVRINGSVRWLQTDIESWIALGCPDRKTFETIKGVNNDR
jgi:predicted DNA-binding transcriptional regulator AlpA